MKLWVDDVRPAPVGYAWCKSVNSAKSFIERCEDYMLNNLTDALDIEVIDIDHDAGDYAYDGGDYIKLLDWLEETGRNYPIHIHSMNPVGVANMRAIIEKNGWKEIKMPRYIDVDTEIEKMQNAVIERKSNGTDDEFTNRIFDTFINALNKAPTADVQEVVRCKDCKFLEIEQCYGVCGRAILGIVNPNDFCSRGEREREKDGEEDEEIH